MLPAIALIGGYQRQWLSTDLVAGLVVFAVTVPAALAYGELAGVDPVVGLHTSLIAMLAYFLFGTSRQLVLGAEATVAVLVATTVATLAPGASPERYLALTGALALLAGGFCILGGLLKFGFIADFLPRQVITGYMNGVALVIIASQAGKLLGIKLEHSAFFPRLAELFGKLGTVHWPTFGLGVLCVLILQLLKWSKSR